MSGEFPGAPVVSVLRAADNDIAGSVWHLYPGQSMLFAACYCGECQVDLMVPVAEGGVGVGRVTAYPDHWRLGNPGPVPLTVEDLEQPADRVTVPASRGEVVIPFELARIIAGPSRLVTVFGPEPAELAAPVAGCPRTPGHPTPSPLDRGTAYYAVLVALCEPRLRQSAGASLPTSAEIADRLTQRGLPVSPRAVDWHIEYLVGKLGLLPGGRIGPPGRSWRKEALVTAALRSRLVSAEDLPN